MRSENTQFVGGPLDGRVLPVLVGMLGNPPRVYRVPVPGPDGAPATEYVYHRAPHPDPRRGRTSRWRYEYDPLGRRPDLPKWPWSRG
ncbi:hypothetical protein ACFW9F_12630 [Streptomyces sp. NPDC059506]|uniref:hypothetical protein n=1 Tax=Streptomyces TaxID=1883 RepID=UPI0015FA8B43|nr:hypothetical protein [Streptomyces sp. SCUT-3]QMV21763.1 hypothetical protein GQS52_08160 [Streptomyces sp. SCUT-3]